MNCSTVRITLAVFFIPPCISGPLTTDCCKYLLLVAFALVDAASLHILVTGKAPEYTLVNAVRVRQVDSQMIEIQHVLWNSLSHGSPASAVLHGVEEFYLAVDRRMRKHLEETAYPVETGNECDTELVEGGFGVMGDIETLMSVIEHSSEQ